ncbi:MAG: TonB-dependent receptor, partial [Pseudomonadota bacterium]
QIEVDFINAGSIETDGIDLKVGKVFSLDDLGTLDLELSGTLITTFDVQETPNSPTIDRLDSRNITSFTRSTPDLRANLRASWNMGRHQVTAFVRHIDDYTDDLNNDRRINSYTSLDLQYAYVFGEGGTGLTDGLRLQAGALNLTDEQPPFVNDRGGFDALVHDPRGRLIYVGLTKQF